MLSNFDPYIIAATIPAILIGFTFHEYAHAWMANRLGDPTARMLGRLTLDPTKHLDPLGTLLIFLAGFGWAKPVPVTLTNIRGNRKLGDIMISLAGPVANIIVAFITILIVGWFGPFESDITNTILGRMIDINVLLAAFNLLPIPPLDGSSLLMNLWPGRRPAWLYTLEQYNIFILLILVFTGVLWNIMIPLMAFIEGTLFFLASLLMVF